MKGLKCQRVMVSILELLKKNDLYEKGSKDKS